MAVYIYHSPSQTSQIVLHTGKVMVRQSDAGDSFRFQFRLQWQWPNVEKKEEQSHTDAQLDSQVTEF